MSEGAAGAVAAGESANSIFRSIFKNTGIYSIAIIAGKMSGFLLMPIYTRTLTPDDYGVMELLELTSFIFGSLIGFRFGDAVFYFHARAETAEERERILSTSFIGAGLLGLCGAVMGYLLSPVLSQIVFGTGIYVQYFHLVFIGFALTLLQDAGFCYLRVLNQATRYVATSIGRLGLAIVSNLVFLLILRMGVRGVLMSSVVTSALMSVYLAARIFSTIRLSFSWGALVRQVKYSLPLGVGGLGMFFIHFGDRFFLRQYLTLADIGIYSLAYKMGMIISYLQMPFDIYWRSQMFSLVKGPQGNKVYIRTCSYLAIGLTVATVFIALFIGPILKVMATPAFAPAAAYVPWIAAIYVIRTIGGHFRGIFLLRRLTGKEATITWVGTSACVIGYALLIPKFGAWGAIAATGIAFSAMFFMGLWQAQKVEHFAFEFGRMGGAALLGVCPAIALYLISPVGFWPQVAAGTILFVAYLVALALAGIIHDEEKQGLRMLIADARARIW